MALDTGCKNRDYLYGRLLAVADRVEYLTYGNEERDKRETNAQRYMSVFSQRPMSTWKIIEERLQPYWVRLSPGMRIKCRKLIDEIFDGFTVEEFKEDKPLGGLYLLGFHSQSLDLRTKEQKKSDLSQDDSEDDDKNETGGDRV